jgi:tellurite methyltransferase
MHWLLLVGISLCLILLVLVIVLQTRPSTASERMISGVNDQKRKESEQEKEQTILQMENDRGSKESRTSDELKSAVKTMEQTLAQYNVPYMVFFGTLLGAVRDGKPIEGDDDIDLVIDAKYFSAVYKMIQNMNMKICRRAFRPNVMIQVKGDVAMDIYFYHMVENESMLHFEWNFYRCNSQNSQHDGTGDCVCMRIPADLIFPIQKHTIADTVYRTPSKPIAVVEYLYGPRWRERLKKHVDYETRCTNFTPQIEYRGNTRNGYWNKYYETSRPQTASPFAKFVYEQYMTPHVGQTLLELGCGDARDTSFFNNHNMSCVALDGSKQAITNNRQRYPDIGFHCVDFTCDHFPMQDTTFDYIYTRWTLHSVDEKTEERMLTYMASVMEPGHSLLFIEARTTQDKFCGQGTPVDGEPNAFIYGHYRRFLDADQLKDRLIRDYDMDIVYYKTSDNFSVVHNDRPHLLRIVAKRTIPNE